MSKKSLWRLAIHGVLVVLLVLSGGACAKKRLKKAFNFYELGTNAFRSGDYISALSFLDKAEALSPRDPDILQMKGMAIFARGDFDATGRFTAQAEALFLRAIDLYKGYEPPAEMDFGRLSMSEARVNLSAVYLNMGRPDDAIREASLAVQDPLFRSPHQAHLNIGMAYFQKQMPMKAIDHLELAVQQNRRFAGGHKALAEVYMSMKKYPMAVKNLRLAIDIFPKYAEAYYLLGVAYQKQNQFQAAASVFKKCKEVEPKGAYGDKCGQFTR